MSDKIRPGGSPPPYHPPTRPAKGRARPIKDASPEVRTTAEKTQEAVTRCGCFDWLRRLGVCIRDWVAYLFLPKEVKQLQTTQTHALSVTETRDLLDDPFNRLPNEEQREVVLSEPRRISTYKDGDTGVIITKQVVSIGDMGHFLETRTMRVTLLEGSKSEVVVETKYRKAEVKPQVINLIDKTFASTDQPLPAEPKAVIESLVSQETVSGTLEISERVQRDFEHMYRDRDDGRYNYSFLVDGKRVSSWSELEPMVQEWRSLQTIKPLENPYLIAEHYLVDPFTELVISHSEELYNAHIDENSFLDGDDKEISLEHVGNAVVINATQTVVARKLPIQPGVPGEPIGTYKVAVRIVITPESYGESAVVNVYRTLEEIAA